MTDSPLKIELRKLARLTTLIGSAKDEAARLGLDAVVVHLARAIREASTHARRPKGIWNHEEGGGHLWRLCLTCGWEGSSSYPMCPECSEITDIAVLHAASPDYQAVAV